MANDEHIAILKNGALEWNRWRKLNPNVRPDLEGADIAALNLLPPNDSLFTGINLIGIDFREANLRGANLPGARFTEADLEQADFERANLSEVHILDCWMDGAAFSGANLSHANIQNSDVGDAVFRGATLRDSTFYACTFVRCDFRNSVFTGSRVTRCEFPESRFDDADLSELHCDGCDFEQATFQRAQLQNARLINSNLSKTVFDDANLSQARLTDSDLKFAKMIRANLVEADLRRVRLIETDLSGADLSMCYVYGVAGWNLVLDGAVQKDLNIAAPGEPSITVDDIETAQFIYLLLNNQKLRRVIDTITSKVVLILGRFTAERKAVLEVLKDAMRKRGYSPVLFDFEVPASRNITETVRLLAHMSRFVIADITEARSIPHELMAIVPNLPSVPIQPIILKSEAEYGMFSDFRAYPWVLSIYRYETTDSLLSEVETHVIAPAEQALVELAAGRL